MGKNRETFDSIRFFFVFLIPCLIMTQVSCSKKSPQQDTLKEYRKMMERQRIATLKEEQEFLKKIPEMTPEEFEKLGDSFIKQGNLDMVFYPVS